RQRRGFGLAENGGVYRPEATGGRRHVGRPSRRRVGIIVKGGLRAGRASRVPGVLRALHAPCCRTNIEAPSTSMPPARRTFTRQPIGYCLNSTAKPRRWGPSATRDQTNALPPDLFRIGARRQHHCVSRGRGAPETVAMRI